MVTQTADQLDLFAEFERRWLAHSKEAVRAAVAPLEAKLDSVLSQLSPIEERRVRDAEVAETLGYSVEGWRNFVRARQARPEDMPPHSVLNGRRLYRMSEVERWLRDHPEVRGRSRRPGVG